MSLFADSWTVAKTIAHVTLETAEALISIVTSPHKAHWYLEAVSVPPLRGPASNEWSNTVEQLRQDFEAADDPAKYADMTSNAVALINGIHAALAGGTGPHLPAGESVAFKVAAPVLLYITQRNHKPLYVALVVLLMIDQRLQDSVSGGTFTDRMAKLLGALAAKAGWTEQGPSGDVDAGWASITADAIVLGAVLLQLTTRGGAWSVLFGLDLADERGASPVKAAHDLLRRAVTLRLPLAPPAFDLDAFSARPAGSKIEADIPPDATAFTLTAIPVPATTTDPEKLFVQLGVGGSFTVDLGRGWRFRYSNDGDGSVLVSHDDFQTFGNARLKAELFQEGDLVGAPGSAAIVAGQDGSAGLSVKSKRIGAGVQVDVAGPAAWLQIDQCEVTVSGGHWLADHLPKLSFTFDAAVDASPAGGVRLRGGVAGDVVIRIAKSVPLGLGTLRINAARLQVAAKTVDDDRVFEIAASTDLTLALFGLLEITTVGLGAAFAVGSSAAITGNLAGVANAGLSLLVPSSAGLKVNRFGLAGEGVLLFDAAAGTLFGGVALDYKKKFSFTGLGIYQTSRAERHANWMIALSMTTAASPGGFVPKGGGFLYASDRATDPKAFLAAVQTGDLQPILAPVDPVRNAMAYQATLDRLFPPAAGSQVVGALVKFEAFGGKLHFDIGALLEWASGELQRFYLIAAFSFIPLRRDAADPKDRPVVVLADGVLVADASTGELDVRIALRNSRLWGAELTGEAMAFYGAADVGEHRAFFLSVGGFHPSYVPGPRLFVPKRLTVTLSKGDHLKLEISAYLALTPISFQIGFRSAIEAHLYGFGIRGSLDIDALIHFDFRIVIDVKISVELLLGSQTLAAVTFQGTLSLFIPTILAGSVKVKFLFWTLSKSGSLPIIDGKPERESVDVTGLIEAAIRDRANWDLGSVSGFAPRARARDGGWYDGSANPVFRQTVIPFGVAVDRFAGATFDNPQTFEVERVLAEAVQIANTPVADEFAVGQYLDLDDDEMLGGAMFEGWQAGFSLDLPFVAAEAVAVSLEPEQLVRDPEAPRERHAALFDFTLIAERLSRFAAPDERPQPIEVHGLDYMVLDAGLGVRGNGLTLAQARARARGGDRVIVELAA